MLGGSGASSGRIIVNGKLARLTIGGSLIGGSGSVSGSVTAVSIGDVGIGHDLIGGSITGTAPSLHSPGLIRSQTRRGSLFIGGSVIAGHDTSSAGNLSNNASIRAGNAIGSITVGGSLIGNTGPGGASPVIISARGQAVQGTNTDVAIGSLTVGDRVEK